ncbi:hypothetical protein C8F01DRAFT_1308375 [Mycena amicta]|nr:hypothetical protein C8F01DRAFT_1308375 [Mycena amicta]
MDAFTTTVPRNIEDVVLPPVNEDGGTGSSGSCVVCKEDTSLPPVNEDGGTGSSGSCCAESHVDAPSSPPMTDADPITIILDDVDVSSVHLPPVDPPDTSYPSKYNDTIALLSLNGLGDAILFKAFDGSTVQLYGVAPPPQFNQTLTMGPLAYRTPGYGGLQYTSPPNTSLSTLVLALAAGFALDYAVVTVFPTTELLETTILVDDSSSSLIWHGSWTEENNFTLPIPCDLPLTPTSSQPQSVNLTHFTADIAPHANTTHASQTRGDEFEFWFTGTSIAVYGVTPAQADSRLPPWLLQMSFTLDAAEPIMVNITSQEFVYEMPHVVYFNASSIPAGNHTLVGKIVDVVGSTLPRARIDYITYKPSFASQAEMPVLPPFAPTTTPSSMSPTSNSDAGSGRSAKVKIISTAVGCAIGAIVLCGLAIGLLLYMRRWRRRNRSRLHLEVNEPFLGSSASTSYIIPVGEKQGTIRLGSDSQESHTDPQAAEANVSPPFVGPSAGYGDNFEQREEAPLLPLAQGDTEILETRVRQLQTQVDRLTREVLPPAYRGDAA